MTNLLDGLPGDDVLHLWIIYKNPSDCPDGYVLRAQAAMRDGTTAVANNALASPDVEALRKIVRDEWHLHCMPRFADDDPAILECWI